MGLNTAGLNVAATAVAGVVGFLSLHTADPGAGGSNEVAGGTPAYARKAVTWNTAAAGGVDNSNTSVFDVPAATTVTHVGFWSAATGGTFYGSQAVTNETFGAQGTYTVTDADINFT